MVAVKATGKPRALLYLGQQDFPRPRNSGQIPGWKEPSSSSNHLLGLQGFSSLCS